MTPSIVLLAGALVAYGASVALFAAVLSKMLGGDDMFITKTKKPILVGRKPTFTLEPQGVSSARLSLEHEGDELALSMTPEELKEMGCAAIALAVELAQLAQARALRETVPSAPNGGRS